MHGVSRSIVHSYCIPLGYKAIKLNVSVYPNGSFKNSTVLLGYMYVGIVPLVYVGSVPLVTGCLHPTPTDHLPLLSGIQPAELRLLGLTLSLVYHGSLDPNHILYGLLSGSSDTCQVRLRSRGLFVPAARNLLDNLATLGIHTSEWTNHKWKMEYCENASRLCVFVPRTGARPVGVGLS